MLEAATESDGPVDDVEKDGVHIVGRVAHDPILHRCHLRHAVPQVARDRRRIIARRPERDANPLAVGLERVEAVFPHECHRVRELVIISRAIDAARWTFQCGRHLPARRQPKPDFRRSRELPLFEHEQVGAEELSEILGGTGDGKIDRIGRVVEIDEDVVSPPGRHAPRVLVGAIPMQCFARRVLRAEPMDVARIILDFVVARAPRGERNEQGVLAGRGEIRGHVELPSHDRDFVPDGLSLEWRREEQDDGEELGKTTHHHSRQEVGPRRDAEAQS